MQRKRTSFYDPPSLSLSTFHSTSAVSARHSVSHTRRNTEFLDEEDDEHYIDPDTISIRMQV